MSNEKDENPDGYAVLNTDPTYNRVEKFIDINKKPEMKPLKFPWDIDPNISRQVRRSMERDEEKKKAIKVLNYYDVEAIVRQIIKDSSKTISENLNAVYTKEIVECKNFIYELQKAHDNLMTDYVTVTKNEMILMNKFNTIVEQNNKMFGTIKALTEKLAELGNKYNEVADMLNSLNIIKVDDDVDEVILKEPEVIKPKEDTLKVEGEEKITVKHFEDMVKIQSDKAKYISKKLKEKFAGVPCFKRGNSIYTDLGIQDIKVALTDNIIKGCVITEHQVFDVD
jgi:hypothetical protein